MENFINCINVSKVYNPGRANEVTALSDVTISIERGSYTILTGPSGSGKTTLISIIGTIERPTRGRISVDGKDLLILSESALSLLRRKRVGFVFQSFNLIPGLTAWENASYPLIPVGIREGERKKKAVEVLGRLGLSGRVDHTPEELSGGEQQRVSIARALINDPDIIILDEPTSNIDSDTARAILGLLGELKAGGRTIILSTHDGDMIKDADAVCRLHRGQLSPA